MVTFQMSTTVDAGTRDILEVFKTKRPLQWTSVLESMLLLNNMLPKHITFPFDTMGICQKFDIGKESKVLLYKT